jgi:serine/threonine protein kinase
VPFLVLEYVEGQTLDALLDVIGPLPTEQLVGLAQQVTAALTYTHLRNFVHRNLKPADIIVTPDGRAKLLDFGVAQWAIADEDSERLHDIRKITETVGTLPYMAPEQSIVICEERSDIFSLGAMLFELATGKRPFEGNNTTGLIDAIRLLPPAPEAKLDEQVSAWLEQVILRCLEKARELLGELTATRAANEGGYVSPVLLSFVHAALG